MARIGGKTFVIAVGQALLCFQCLSAGELYLNEGWEFRRGDEPDWKRVRIPHDWAISGPFDRTNDLQFIQVTQDGEVTKNVHTGRTAGLPWLGKGEYRRMVRIPEGTGFASLVFGGAMSHARVFVDDREMGSWPCGYSAFEVKIPAIAGEHDVRVSLENLPSSSRWYPGAGLYRPVRLVLGNEVGIPVWGRRITTPDLETVRVETDLRNPKKRPVEVEHLILDSAGRIVAKGRGATCEMKVADAQVWSPETPNLYRIRTSVRLEGRLVDEACEPFGFRTVSFSREGFFLNGWKRRLRGVCLHHTLGPLGAAYNDAAFRRQLRLLKDMGCDSVRTSHNAPNAEQLVACDELGLLVVPEAFDEWMLPKCENGYHRDFADWWRRDLRNLVWAHGNHPSVILWSIGNEVPDQGTPDGAMICRMIQDECHRLDPTRLVTMGIDHADDACRSGLMDVIDVPGLNYRTHKYDMVYECVRERTGFVLATETASTISSRGVYKFPDEPVEPGRRFDDLQLSSYDTEACPWSNLPDDDWATQDSRPWVLGEFVWNGVDYLGEPTPYKREWPARSSYFGIIDLAGIPKDRYWLYRSQWNRKDATLHVLPHWTWPGREGLETPVYVYTSYPSAELFVNGVSQGVRKFDPTSRLDRYRLRWRNVRYEPGELKVIAYDSSGRETEHRIVRTAGRPARLEIIPEQKALCASSAHDGGRPDLPDLGFFRVRIVDKQGTLCPDADRTIDMKVSGAARFRAVCNGDPTSLESFVRPSMRAFHGELTVVVEAGNDAGEFRLEVTSDGLQGVVVKIPVLSEERL